MEQFKANLSILNGRYCDLERRVLDIFAKHTEGNLIWLSGDFTILLLNLIADGLLEDTGQTSGVFIAGVPSRIQYRLTQKGRRFIEEWLSAKQLE
jgi:DNA-binding PadR family transcriptional regulator